MRKLLIATVVLLVLAVAVLIAADVSLQRLIDANRDRLIQAAQQALGRPVSVGRIGVSLWRGPGARLDDVRIAEDEQFGTDDFVRVQAVIVRARLWPLLRGRFKAKRIDLVQPRVNLIRDAS